MGLRIGITMRITNALGYDEPRDTIAHDWSKYILNAFPQAKFMYLPNIGEKAVNLAKKWDINVIIISGGDDLGVYTLRDKTEISLLKYAIDLNIPTIAICRGMQLAYNYFGGKIMRGDNDFVEKHRATHHIIKYGDELINVNSYHTNLIDERTINKEIDILARCKDDNSIEAFQIRNILAFMWHPERDNNVSVWNKLLIEDFIKKVNEK